MKRTCDICPHQCEMEEGQTGYCRARKNTDSKITCDNYGNVTSIALDPIEKKPLKRFYPGSNILSVGSYGCNLACPFCQNHSISMQKKENMDYIHMTPDTLVQKAKSLKEQGNIGVAYTYNEPLIGYEYVMDCAMLVHTYGMKNVVVTNGYINEEPLSLLLPHIDGMNIDLKGFTNTFYKNIKGNLETVKKTIELSANMCHVEVTTLLIPGENDSKEEVEAMAKWLMEVDKNITLHLTRFFPLYLYQEKNPTDIYRMKELKKIAENYLTHVYLGNC